MSLATLKAKVIELFDAEIVPPPPAVVVQASPQVPTAPVPMPSPPAHLITNVWPLQRDCIGFYGDPTKPGWLAANTVDVLCPWQLYYGGNDPAHPIALQHILIHRKCSESLIRVMASIWDAVGHDLSKIKQLRYDQFDGSYNLRPMRGGSALSMHSFACAIDFDASDNVFHSEKHLFTDDSLIIVKFKEEGWICGLDWSPGSIDAQHVQAARIHD